jgi:hypothetical protein
MFERERCSEIGDSRFVVYLNLPNEVGHSFDDLWYNAFAIPIEPVEGKS